MEAKKATVAILKAERKVSPRVLEERKKYVRIQKAIKEALKEEGKTIPQIAAITEIPSAEVTYYLMTMLKFFEVEVEGVDDMDEYFIYKLKSK